MEAPKTPLLFNCLAGRPTQSHEEALLRIYQRLRPGNPPQLEKARTLFQEKFYDVNRYRLGKVGRFRINRKLDSNHLGKRDDVPSGRLDRVHQLLLDLAVSWCRSRGRRHRPSG